MNKIPAWVDKCVESLLPDLRKRYPKRSADDLVSSAWAICTDRYKQMKKKGKVESVPTEVKTEQAMPVRRPEIVVWYSKAKVFETFTEAIDGFSEGAIELHGMQEAFDIIKQEKKDLVIDEPVILETEIGDSANLSTESVATKPSPKHFYIRGTAIGEGTTRNLNHYRSDELKAAAPSLAGRPIQADHGFRTRDNVGKVLVSSYEPANKTISYVGRIRRGHEATDAVELGDVDTVSIGATVEDILCNVCGKSRLDINDRCKHHVGQAYDGEIATRVGIGLEFVELSVTPFPAYKQSSVGLASTHDSMDMALAVFESWKTETTREAIKLSEQQESNLDSTMKLTEMTKTNKSLQDELGTAQAELKKAHDREKEMLAGQIVEAEIELGIKQDSDAEKRVEHLRSKEIEGLNLLYENMSDQLSQFRRSQSVPASKGIVSSDEPVRDPMSLTKEEAKMIILKMLGWPEPSKSAKATVRDYTRNTYHPLYSEYVSRAAQSGSA